MGLSTGTRLGPYEILAPLGAGGMGEVYRARDTKLNREVAVKVLPPTFAKDATRVARFRREAQLLASLNHPNIAAIYGLEEADGVVALALELVDGEDLAERLRRGPIPVDEVLAIGKQIAEGLEAAHEKGITHRDLKPANLKLTRGGVVKILDFGLAKAYEGAAASGDSGESALPTKSVEQVTEDGVILGTVAYMSPEQARGAALDKRSDIWSFGVVLFEMLTGKRLFRGETTSDTLAAVLRQELKYEALPEGTPESLRRILRRCLERDPRSRLRDIGEARVAFGEPSGIQAPAAPQLRRARSLAGPILIAAALILVAAAIAWKGSASVSWPTFQRITFRRGTVTCARFVADGGTVVYSAQWEGKPAEVFSVRGTSQESRTLDLADAMLLAVSPSDELALKLRPTFWGGHFHGTLARVPLSGGSPRELLDRLQDADWSPDGNALAIVRQVAGRWEIEYPAGKPLTQGTQSVNALRVSPDGSRIALALGDNPWDPHPTVSIVDRAGSTTVLAEARVTGLAWAGKEVWYTSAAPGEATDLNAVTLSGSKRLVFRAAGAIALQDISRNGDLLVSMLREQSSIMCLPPGAPREIDLAWLGGSRVVELSHDGSMVLLNETEADRQSGSFYVRKTDGSPAIRLGEGFALSISSDGKWVLARPDLNQNRLLMVPIGAGEPKQIPLPTRAGQLWFFPDGRRILVGGLLASGQSQLYSVDLDGRSYRAIAPEGIDTFIGEQPISPDGKFIAAQETSPGSVKLRLYPAEGGVPLAVPGFEEDDVVISWAEDGKSLFIFKRNKLPARIFKLDLATGQRSPWLELMPADPAGVTRIVSIALTPDGRSYAYNLKRELSDLYLIRGLK